LIPLSKIIFRVSVALRVLALFGALLGLAPGDADELLVEAAVANISLLGVQVLEESFSNDRVCVD